MNIIDAVEDKNLFGPLFKDLTTWEAWRVFLKSVFALPLTDEELALFQNHTARNGAPERPFSEVFAIVGRRGGKSFISSVIACYLALFHDWSGYLSPGEIAWVMVIATDRIQARVILNYIKGILQLPIFKKMVLKDLEWEIRLNNRVAIAIKTCDYRTLRGYTVAAAICDEIAFWRAEGANPANEILTALRPAMATVPGSMLLGISTPYNRVGPLYEAFRDKYGKEDPDSLIWRASTSAMNPTISAQFVEKAVMEDYAAAKAEWLADFRDDLESFLSTEAIESAIISDRWELPKLSGVDYFAFADPSGGRADSFTLALAHKDRRTKKIILDRLEERCPPLKPQNVAEEYSKILKSYRVARVTGDRYAGEWVVREFRDRGIYYRPSDLSKSEIYLEFEPLMAQGLVELLDNKKLVSQFRGLERRTRSGGKDAVDHYPGGNDDMANAAAGAIALASKGDSGRVRIRRLA